MPEGPGRTGEPDLQSVRRAFAALDVLVASAPRAVRVADLARHLEVSPATASRVLTTLVEEGYAARTPDRRYTIGVRSLPLATNWLRRLRDAALGPAIRVADQTGEIVVVSQLLGGEQVPLLWHLPRRREGIGADVLGHVLSPYPLWATASGRALLGSLPSEQRSRLLPPEPVPRLTDATPLDRAGIRSAIKAGLKGGLHFERGEVHSGLWCCSVALEPTGSGERLALAAVCLAEPSATQERRIHRVLRQEAFTTIVGLTALGAPE
ncbi:IclR family transcriptional regulator [Amycolatopsis sp. NPDC051903]|uniref:IclR family transcriptional regulator n=1 Tax=Amycolatopsis sp. NPDC051903 TaxID=3363936 RepID=UPI003795728D